MGEIHVARTDEVDPSQEVDQIVQPPDRDDYPGDETQLFATSVEKGEGTVHWVAAMAASAFLHNTILPSSYQ